MTKPSAAWRRIPIADIRPNPDQPRKKFDPAKILELADSILVNGLQTPIQVRPMAQGFEIIMGERRWRAHQLLVREGHSAFAEIDAGVENVDDRTRDVRAIVENLQREDIEPMEEARAFGRLVDQGMAPEDIAKACGCALFRVTWRLRLLELEPGVCKLFEAGHLDKQQAMELARLDHAHQVRMVQLINRGQVQGWKATRSAVEAVLDGKSQVDIFGEDLAPRSSPKDAETVSRMEARIAQAAALLSAGFKDGECIVAARVSLDRAGTMADRLAVMRTTLATMERELRNVTAQGAIALDLGGSRG